jgi:hypothetical protein
MYNLPLTLKTKVKPGWKEVTVKQGNEIKRLPSHKDEEGTYVLYQAMPNGGNIGISGI